MRGCGLSGTTGEAGRKGGDAHSFMRWSFSALLRLSFMFWSLTDRYSSIMSPFCLEAGFFFFA